MEFKKPIEEPIKEKSSVYANCLSFGFLLHIHSLEAINWKYERWPEMQNIFSDSKRKHKNKLNCLL